MKKILCLMFIITVFSFSGCKGYTKVENTAQYTKKEVDNTSMFVVVEETYGWTIVYHKKTKVMWAISAGYANGSQGVFTLMVDADGNPLLYEEVS